MTLEEDHGALGDNSMCMSNLVTSPQTSFPENSPCRIPDSFSRNGSRSPDPRTRSMSRSTYSAVSPDDKFHTVKRGREDEAKTVIRELQMSDVQR